MPLLDRVELAPADPILGLTEAFVSDQRPNKVNLGVGVYLDEHGKLPLMQCVGEAQHRLAHQAKAKSYLGIDGLPAYRDAIRRIVFGEDEVLLARTATVQTLGGTGALKVGADLLQQLDPDATVFISEPSWENHRALFARAGFEVRTYRYYDAHRRGIDADGMLNDLRAAEPGSIVVLHACCHNPTGYDLGADDWERVVAVLAERNLMPFLDMAYQGFGFGIEEDSAVVRKFTASGMAFFLATSYSKSFSLYGERVGSLSVVTRDPDEAARVLSQLKICIRTNYSNPSTWGAALVATVLDDPELLVMWQEELDQMRERITRLRRELVESLAAEGVDDMGFITDQHGMFSYSGLSKQHMQALRSQHAVYGTDAGRLCMAALNSGNLERVASAIAAVRR